jgi:uncharacterized protein YjbJ (UPF0337 family)
LQLHRVELATDRCVVFIEHHRRNAMATEHAKGAWEKTKGAVKDAVGGLTGNTKLQVDGKIDKAKGAVHETVGDMKDAAKRGAHQVDKEVDKA